MTTSIVTKQGTFKLTSVYKGDKAAPWSNDHGRNTENWNNHIITVSHNGKTTRFEFWNSISEGEITKDEQLKDSFNCFLSDAIAGKDSFENFCSEFGYDQDSRKAEKIHKACMRSTAKIERLFDGDLYDLVNELNEVEL